MTVRFHPNFDIPDVAVAPDSYDYSSGQIPSENFVVTRNRDGSVASRYGDPFWDCTAYELNGRTKRLHFPYSRDPSPTAEKNQLNQEARWILFLLMWMKPGEPFSLSTLDHNLVLIRALAKFADRNNCTIKDILANDRKYIQFAISGISCSMIIKFYTLSRILKSLGENLTGFNLASDKTIKQILVHTSDSKQFSPIPTRIYSIFISKLASELEDFEAVADRCLELFMECSKDPMLGRHKSYQSAVKARLGIKGSSFFKPSFRELLLEYGLENYFVKKNLPFHQTGLKSGIADVQLAAKLYIQTFSGMRDNEAASLPYCCIETVQSDGNTHYLISGKTTKLNKGLIKRTTWVTSKEGHRAIIIAQRIADAIYATVGVAPQRDDLPLFVSRIYVPNARRAKSHTVERFLPSTFGMRDFHEIRSRLVTTIEEGDIKELEQLDPHRAWRAEEKFQIGKTWSFTTHQLRRSLALYAQRSGLVSLPSLRRQLQHITEEMSRYYARGSSYAKNLIGKEKEHFGREWQETVPVSSALSYIQNVLLSNEVLFGGHMNWVNQQLCSSDGTLLVDYEATLLRFKKGEIFYKETFLGGCTNVDQCKQTPLRWLDVECLRTCTNLVGNLHKLERVIKVQSKMIRTLDPSSAEFRTENADLRVLVTTRDKVLGQQGAP